MNWNQVRQGNGMLIKRYDYSFREWFGNIVRRDPSLDNFLHTFNGQEYRFCTPVATAAKTYLIQFESLLFLFLPQKLNQFSSIVKELRESQRFTKILIIDLAESIVVIVKAIEYGHSANSSVFLGCTSDKNG